MKKFSVTMMMFLTVLLTSLVAGAQEIPNAYPGQDPTQYPNPYPGFQPGQRPGPGDMSQAMDPRARFSQWCDRADQILARAQAAAGAQLYRGNTAAAEQILVQAMREAQAGLASGGLMTLTVLERGLVLWGRVSGEVPASHPLNRNTRVFFLNEYVKFAQWVIRELDMPYYVDYRSGGCWRQRPGYCGAPGFDYGAFQQAFLAYAQEQLGFVADRFTVDSGLIPLGNPRLFLALARDVSGFVAQDLSSHLQAYAYACVIQDLSRLSRDIDAYLRGGGHWQYPTERDAVAQVSYELRSLSTQVVSCPFIRP